MFTPDEDPSGYDFHAPSIADQHAQWHQVHGRDAVCPLDCGVGENYDDPKQPDEEDPMNRPCEACNAEAGEECLPMCLGAAQKYDDEHGLED